jgi:hypothetical protein
MGKSKAIGTQGETDVVNYLKMWWNAADRRILAGEHDRGDITGVSGVCMQVKAGRAAERAGYKAIRDWLAETEEQARNCDIREPGGNFHIPVLVVKRAGKGAKSVGQWRAILPGWAVVRLLAGEHQAPGGLGPVEFELSDVVGLLLAPKLVFA